MSSKKVVTPKTEAIKNAESYRDKMAKIHGKKHRRYEDACEYVKQLKNAK